MREPIEIRFTGGINNQDTPLDCFVQRQLKRVPVLINADTELSGKIIPLRPKRAMNSTVCGASVHTILKANLTILVGAGDSLYYLDSDDEPVLLKSGLNDYNFHMAQVGNWVYGTDYYENFSVYIGSDPPVYCSWGHAVPESPPTVVAGAAGNPDGTYICYYRYKITLPDGTILRTGLSEGASVDVTGGKKIEWSAMVHASYTGATAVQIELFRTMSGWSATYLVATIDEGTTAYSDNVADATVQANTEFDETGYYPPPSSAIRHVFYHEGADRVFVAVGGDVYWSEPALYNVFVYNERAAEYTNVNSVFLGSQREITCMALLDEQLYLGAEHTWRRLRGTDPAYWAWESVGGAIKGPMDERNAVVTKWGIIYPGNDHAMWIFNGFETDRIITWFRPGGYGFPSSTSFAIFDGRFLSLFLSPTAGLYDYPEFRFDFLNYPTEAPRVVVSSRNPSAAFYHNDSDEIYFGTEDGYIQNDTDVTTDVTMSFYTPEIPVEGITKYGDAATMYVDFCSGGDQLSISVYLDESTDADDLTAITAATRQRKAIPLLEYPSRTIMLQFSLTTHELLAEIREPLIITGDEDADPAT